MKDDPRSAYLLVNLACAAWSTNFIAGRLLSDHVGPAALSALRFSVAGLVFAGVLARAPAAERSLAGQRWLLLAMALTGIVAYNLLAYGGLRYTTATNAVLINGATPLLIGLLGALVLGEHSPRRLVFGALISLTGVGVIVSGGSWQALVAMQFNRGDVLIFGSALAWATYTVLSRVATRRRTALSASALSCWLGLPFLYAAGAVEWHAAPVALSWTAVLGGIYVGLVPAFLALSAWNEGVRRLGAGRAAAFYNMLPVYGTLLGVVVLGEPFGWPQMLGGGLVVGGSLASIWDDLRPRRA